MCWRWSLSFVISEGKSCKFPMLQCAGRAQIRVKCLSSLDVPSPPVLLILTSSKALNLQAHQLTSYSLVCLWTGPCLSVSSSALFCLYYCNHFAGPDLCGCAGSFTTKLHGNRVKVEYLLEEAIWRQAVCTGGLVSLVGSPLSL